MDPLRRLSAAERFAPASCATTRRQLSVTLGRCCATAESSGSSFGDSTYCTALLWISVAPVNGIVIELEGNVHDTEAQRGYDQARTGFLQAAGYRVIRMRNRDVSRQHLETVLRGPLRT